MTERTARQEWAAMWPLPLVSMLGYVGGAAFSYSAGVSMVRLTEQFGWSRAEFSSAFTIHSLVMLVTAPIVGRLADRIGSRKVALAGIVPYMVGLSLFGLATGSIWQWWLLSFLQALCASLIGGAIWMKAVVGRFSASRGLALATVLAGSGVATSLWPLLAAMFIEHLGWRLAYPAMALGWGAVMLPLAFLFFHDGEQAEAAPSPRSRPLPFRQVLASRTFLCLAIAGALFSPLTLGILMHLVPIFQGNGIGLAEAAGIAALTGLFAIAGRLATGLLLDLFPTRPVAIAVFLLPAVLGLLMLNLDGSATMAIVAVAVLGFVSGADGDIIAYLIARAFDREVFASVYAIMVSILSLSSSLGPLVAGAIYDRWHSYTPYFVGIIPVALLAAVLVGAVAPGGRRRLAAEPKAA
jgi:MFS family permease